MPRTADPDQEFRVSIHVTKGYRYASTQPSFLDKETGERRYRHVHWGKVDAQNKFIPGKEYLLASIEERKKLIFPPDWDISEIFKLSVHANQTVLPVVTQDEDKLYGDVWLLEQRALSTLVREDLTKVFSGNLEMVDIVLTIAYFMKCCNGAPYNQLADWQDIEKTPFATRLTSSFITKALQKIKSKHRAAFLKLRIERMSKNACCPVDSTTRSAWGHSLCEVDFGYNKDGLPLPQTIEVVTYSLTDHVPVYYRTFQGNMADVRSFSPVVNELESLGFKDGVLITDRGYQSMNNIDELIDRDMPAIMGTKTSLKFVKETIRELGEIKHHPESMELDPHNRIYYRQYNLEYEFTSKNKNTAVKARDLRLNLYFDPAKHNDAITDIEVKTAIQGQLLNLHVSNKTPLPDSDEAINEEYGYYDIDYDKTTRLVKGYSINNKKYENKKLLAGFYANVTHKVNLTATEAQNHYKLRDEQEKYYAMMKGFLGCDRQRNWSEAAKEGCRFVLFVAQILGCTLANERKTKLKQFDSIGEILRAMRPIRFISHPGTDPYMTPFVSKQVEICQKLNIPIPKGCAPQYAETAEPGRRRGRPRKITVTPSNS